MKSSIFYLFLFLIIQFFCIEKNHAASRLTATTPFSISAKADSLEEIEDLFVEYQRNEPEEKRLRKMANATIILMITAFLSFLIAIVGGALGILGALSLIGSTVLGIITFIKARDYRKRLKYLEEDDSLYESHKKISNLSKVAFIIALLPFSLIFLGIVIGLVAEGSDSDVTPFFFGAIGILTFFGLERFVFRTNDIK